VATLTKEELLASVEEAKQKSANVKARSELTYAPQWRNFKGKDFSNTRMADMFADKVIKNGDFTNCNLDGADFQGFILQGCKFTGASVVGANFAGADMRWSNMNGCDYNGKAYFGSGATAADMKEVDGFNR
jgi:uncharacterized protein YjbI with pentapeptide repeats